MEALTSALEHALSVTPEHEKASVINAFAAAGAERQRSLLPLHALTPVTAVMGKSERWRWRWRWRRRWRRR
jgi:hypothetical protein